MTENNYDTPPTNGLCKGKTDLFYPPSTKRKEAHEKEEMAKTICRQCPFMKDCYQYALRNELYGVWGGATEKEREEARRFYGIALRRFDSIVVYNE